MKKTLLKLEEDKNQTIVNSLKKHMESKKSIESFKNEFSNKRTIFENFQLPGITKYAVELQERTLNMKYKLELNKNHL